MSLEKYTEARDLLERTLRIKEMYYEKDHVEMVNTFNNLSLSYKSLGDNVKARDFLERASRIKEKEEMPLRDVNSEAAQANYYISSPALAPCYFQNSDIQTGKTAEFIESVEQFAEKEEKQKSITGFLIKKKHF